MANESGILIVGETADGHLTGITGELLTAARRLAETTKEPVYAALIGEGVRGLAQQAIALGADKVYVADAPIFKEYLNETSVAAAVAIAKEANPSIVLVGHTPNGRDLGPSLAFRLGTGISTDNVELAIDPATKGLRAVRPLTGGLFRQVIAIKTKPQVATVRVKVFEPGQPDSSRQGQVVTVNANVASPKTRLVGREIPEQKGIRLEDAKIVVSGGRGMGSAEAFKPLEGLAALLHGAVGATRAACDTGYYRPDVMIGLTGRVVSPDLYLAVGISGASQHMAGCSGSKYIVAINKDPNANIFKESEFGVVGDYKEVLPAFIDEVKKLVAST